jgi:uncharacterized protein (TIGR03435 family)
MRLSPFLLAGVALLCGLAFGQTSPAKPGFEVVSIKPGSPGSLVDLMQSGRMHSRIDDAQVDLGCVSLSAVIQMAFDLSADRISGPGWLADARFDILAKLPAGASKSQAPEMLQSMLAERFHLTVHHDQKVMAVFRLLVGKQPLKLKESANDDSDPIPCNGGPPPKHHVCHKVGMEDLANQLTQFARTTAFGIDRPVIDMTGLKGVYDFNLDYGREGGRGGGSEAADLSIVDGLRQLGLKLEPARQAFDYLVIDHVDRAPTEN